MVNLPLENKWSSFRDIRLWEGENLSFEGEGIFCPLGEERNCHINWIEEILSMSGILFHERADYIYN